jgi:DNA-binding NarL/FixJ family response regulator
VVDDEPLVRNFLRKLLEKQRKYHVLTAASGEEALRLSRQSSDRIDVLITDFEIGKMNGIQLYTQLAKERPGTAVLFVSAEVDVFRESYPDWPFLNKPFVPKEFLTKLQEVHSAQ